MNVVIAGASGFVGRHLVARLRSDGHEVRCGTRNPVTARPSDWNWVALDVDRPETFDAAFAGCEALVYLVHQMTGGHGPDLLRHEAEAADHVVAAAKRHGLHRIVFLGAPRPAGRASPHLEARLCTGERLRSSEVSCIELRASMIIGAGSESWTMVRDLAMRLPIMVLPRWLATRSSPIGITDVVDALAAAVVDDLPASAAFDLPGPEYLTAREVLTRTAATSGFQPVMIPVPVLTPKLSAHWLQFVTRADYTVARQLVAGLGSDLPCDGPSYWDRMNHRRPRALDEVMREALAADPVTGNGGRWERFVRRVAWPA
jgi:uncharacterized protein YbjT (DUF2867 family)